MREGELHAFGREASRAHELGNERPAIGNVDGELREEEMASFVHEVVVAWLIRVLGNWTASRGAFVVGSDLKLGVSSHRGRKADLAVYFRRGKIQERAA